MFETIVALATPPLKSALAIIRLSGDDCFNVVNKVFDHRLTKKERRKIYYGHIVDNKKIIDEVILLAYISPYSFTGEDSVEIICHGSTLITNQIIQLLLSNGARMATNGEFSSRAFLNNKIDLVQAEAINDLINATTIEGRDLSILSLEGKTSSLFKPIKNKIGELLANIEVNIDYPEYEDIEEISREKINEYCFEIINELEALIKNTETSKLYNEGVNIAIVGKPNVGKSSLLNAFLNEDKAIVSDIAGTTRDVVEGEINLDGVPVRLFDTAGFRQSSDKLESLGIKKINDVIVKADLIIYVASDEGIDEELYSDIKDKKHIIVFNKSDLIKDKISNNIYISAINNDIESLTNKIKEMMGISLHKISPSFNNSRQLGLLIKMVNYLKCAIKDNSDNQPIDLISVSIMSAYNCALDLLGESNKNDLTDEIFSRFCVGK